VGRDRDRDVRAGVEEELRGWRKLFEEFAGEFGQVCRRKIFLAELDEVDTFGGPAGDMFDERGLLVALVAGIECAVGNGVAEHLILSVCL
jgi:hypothetical protein